MVKEKSIIFENTAELDPRAWSVMGLSVKKKDNAIGMFGTGFKMAIATLLRNNQGIVVYSAGKVYNFSVRKEEFRGEAVNMIYCNDQQMPFTTHLAKNWEIWQAYREIYCNCKDEEGTVREWGGEDPFATAVVLTGDKVLDVYRNQSDFFCDRSKALAVISNTYHGLEIIGGSGRIFYKGNLANLNNYNSLYNYNINSKSEIYLKLTEDRTIQVDERFKKYMGRAIQLCQDKNIIKHIITLKDDNYMEYYFKYDLARYTDCSKEFMEVLNETYEKSPNSLNPALLQEFRSQNPKAKIKSIKINKGQKKMIENASMLLADMGYNINCNINLVESECKRTVAFAYEGQIYLTEKAFETTNYLAITLFEELAHVNYGFDDCTRKFQNYLISQIFKQAGH